jgi:hypothetical protein
MVRTIALVAGVAALSASPALAAVSTASQTKAQAEIRVLQIVSRSWLPSRLPGIVNPRTHLLVRNTQVACHGRGNVRIGRRFVRFLCIVRPRQHTPRQGLYLSYRVRTDGSITVHWLSFQAH